MVDGKEPSGASLCARALTRPHARKGPYKVSKFRVSRSLKALCRGNNGSISKFCAFLDVVCLALCLTSSTAKCLF